MTRIRLSGVGVLLVLFAAVSFAADPPRHTPKEGLQAVQVLVGSWRGTGLPEGTREQKQKGLWEETIHWQWQFKDKDVCLKATIDKGKYFTAAELRYLPKTDTYQLTATTATKEKVVYEGPLKAKHLTLDRTDDKTKEVQRLVITLLHDNRYLYKYEVKPAEKPTFRASIRSVPPTTPSRSRRPITRRIVSSAAAAARSR